MSNINGEKMTDYKWKCQACDTVMNPQQKECTSCGCPANVNATNLEKHQRDVQLKKNMLLANGNNQYCCIKCGCNSHETSEIRATGGFFSAFFNVQNKIYTAVTCTKCSYTEFYKGDSNHLASITDFLFGK